MNKVFYWSPFNSKVATVKSVINSAESLNRFFENKKFKVIGFDLNKKRVSNLNKLIDANNEFKKKELKLSNGSKITNYENELKNCNFFIVTVPTPIKQNKLPDLQYIVSAFKTISKYIKNDDIVFLESTVFPGTTEEICKKIIEKKKKIKFYIGYSSERINPDLFFQNYNLCKI